MVKLAGCSMSWKRRLIDVGIDGDHRIEREEEDDDDGGVSIEVRLLLVNYGGRGGP